MRMLETFHGRATAQGLVACEKFTSPDRSGILFFWLSKKKIERSAGIAPPKPTNGFSSKKRIVRTI